MDPRMYLLGNRGTPEDLPMSKHVEPQPARKMRAKSSVPD